jgi:hypothetical protein
MAWLGDDIVFCHTAYVSGPLANTPVGVLRPNLGPPGAPGTIVPVPLTVTLPGTTLALCVDPQGLNAYLAQGPNSPAITWLYRIPLSLTGTPVTPVQVAVVPGFAQSLAFDNDGTMLAGLAPAGGSPLYRIDLTQNPPLLTPLPSTLARFISIAVETATGALIGADEFNPVPPQAGRIYRIPAGGQPVQLGLLPCYPTCIAVNPSLRTYGPATPGANSYAWAIQPNMGGAPTVANAGFRLNLQSAPGSAPGLLGLSLAAGSQWLGFNLLLDPATLVLHGVVPAQTQATIPLPIPAAASLSGLRVFAQTVHFEGASLASPNGLAITIY